MTAIPILYQDNNILAVNKPAGIPVQKDKTGITPLLTEMREALDTPIYLVHRLDLPVSGVVLFALTKEAQKNLSSAFQSGQIAKNYLAITRFRPKEKSGELHHFIQKNGRVHKAFVSQDKSAGAKVITSYKLVGESTNLFLLEVRPKGGKYHQIRAQLADMGCPIRGDVKYGDKRTNRTPGINLHAHRITFQHPISGTILSVEAPVPDRPEWKAFENTSYL